MAEYENTLAESEMRRPNHHGRVWIGWPNHHGRIREYFGRITMAEPENTLAESPWPNPRILWPSHLGRTRMGNSIENSGGRFLLNDWLEIFNRPNLKALVSAYALVAAVRNLAYQSASSGPWCVRCLGTCPAWLGSRLGAHRWSHPFCKLTGSFKALIRTKNGVYSCPSLLISEKQK